MPDRRRHRGQHPEDDRLFATAYHDALRTAVAELSWLLTRGYAIHSALKLAGDRYDLTARQRMAVRRSSCSDQSLDHRAATMTTLKASAGQPIGIDGYNLLITIESALSGGLILVGRDGCCRDLASVHGTYRKVEETKPAVELILDLLSDFDIPRVDWYLDRPVSNSGRLKTLIADAIAESGDTFGPSGRWNIELVDSPDTVLASSSHPAGTSDSAVLDRCAAWLNLAADIIAARVPAALIVDLRIEQRLG